MISLGKTPNAPKLVCSDRGLRDPVKKMNLTVSEAARCKNTRRLKGIQEEVGDRRLLVSTIVDTNEEDPRCEQKPKNKSTS